MIFPALALSEASDGRILFTYNRGSSIEAGILDPRDSVISLYGDEGQATTRIDESTILFGSANDDVVYGGSGHDELNGYGGEDTLYGGAGNDFLIGGAGLDDLFGGTGNDEVQIFDGEEVDHADGGAGTDTLNLENVFSAGVTLTGGGLTGVGGTTVVTGFEIIKGTQADDTLFNDAGMDTIFGNGGNDQINGGAFTDALFGGAGDDTFIILNGDIVDDIDGGDGFDNLILSDITLASGAVTLDLSNTATPNFTGEGGTHTVLNIESVTGTQVDDVIIGDGGTNFILGQDGDDQLRGGGGTDDVRGRFWQ